MNITFVKNAQHNVDSDNRGQDQQGFARQGAGKDLGCSLEAAPDRVRHIDGPRRVLDNLCRLLKRSARIQIKGECHCRELTLVIYRCWRVGALNVRNGAERNLNVGGAGNVNFVKGGGISQILRRSLQDYMELVAIVVDDRNLPLTEGAVEGAVDLLRLDPKLRGLDPVYDHIGLQAHLLLVGRQVLQLGTLFQCLHQLGSIRIQILLGRTDQRVDVLALGRPTANGDILRRLQEDADARYFSGFAAYSSDHLRGGDVSLISWL